MQWGPDHPHADQAEQRERLSAWLDGDLEPDERGELERHLERCAWCRNELAALRQVRDLLRALPSPRLPRSFALPETGPLPAPAAVGHAPPPPKRERLPDNVVSAPEVAHARALRTNRRWATAARRVGGMVAVLGLALLGGSFILGLLQSGAHATSSSTAAPFQGQGSNPGVGPVRAPTAASQTPTPNNQFSPAHSYTGIPGPSIELSSGEEVPLVVLVGGGMLGGGLIVLVSAGVVDRGGRRQVSS